MNSFTEDTDQWAFHKRPNLKQEGWFPPEPISINKLNDIALLVKSLTYLEMLTLAAEINSCGELSIGGLCKDNLADILYQWSLTHAMVTRD